MNLYPIVQSDEKDIWSPSQVQASWRAEQVLVMLQNNPFSGLGIILVVFLVVWLAQPNIGYWRAILWCLPLLLATLLYIIFSLKLQGRDLTKLSDPSIRLRFVISTIVVACSWGLMMAGIYPFLSRDGQFMVGLISTATMLIGAFTVATVIEVGIAWVVTLTPWIVMFVMRGGTEMHFILGSSTILMGIISVASVIAINKSMQARLVAESEARQDRQALTVLLRDIESQSDDWAWGVNNSGQLIHAAPALIQALGDRESNSVLGRSFLSLMAKRLSRDDPVLSGLTMLESKLAQDIPFRNIELKISNEQFEQSKRVWSISGVPVRQDDGKIGGWRGVIRDISVLRNQAMELNRLASTDSLTGLSNRHFLMKSCTGSLEQMANVDSSQGLVPVSLYLLDLDDFKSVNDTFGHFTGDSLLQEIAQRLQNVIQRRGLTSDTVLARLGGDEFALLLSRPHTVTECGVIAQELCDCLLPSWITDTLRVDIRASIGVAFWHEPGTMADRLLREADIALYEAKTTGRNQARIYSADMGERVARRTLISKELSQLLKHDGKDGFGPGQVGCLSVMYQPQVNLVSGEMVGAEALLRWQHPDQDRMRAAEFIQVAEDTGLIIALGQWVLEQACREAANWPENLRVAVNVSGQQLAKGQLVPMVGQALRMTGLPAHRLELEITETALMSKPEEGRSILLDLRQLGVKIALDDFGTGYSSLAYLSTLPVDVVKLDRAFVVAMRYDTKVQTVVASIIQLCQSLGVTTLAEGIEDKHQLDLLLRHGCQLGQGFLYDPALPAAAISTWSIKKALDHVLTV